MKKATDILLIEKIFHASGYDVTSRKGDIYCKSVELHYRKNADGNIHWLWPVGSRRANCLRFAHEGSQSIKLFNKIAGLLFYIGLERFYAQGIVTLFMREADYRAMENKWGIDYAIFTGTSGVYRKALVWHGQNEKGIF